MYRCVVYSKALFYSKKLTFVLFLFATLLFIYPKTVRFNIILYNKKIEIMDIFRRRNFFSALIALLDGQKHVYSSLFPLSQLYVIAIYYYYIEHNK